MCWAAHYEKNLHAFQHLSKKYIFCQVPPKRNIGTELEFRRLNPKHNAGKFNLETFQIAFSGGCNSDRRRYIHSRRLELVIGWCCDSLHFCIMSFQSEFTEQV